MQQISNWGLVGKYLGIKDSYYKSSLFGDNDDDDHDDDNDYNILYTSTILLTNSQIILNLQYMIN